VAAFLVLYGLSGLALGTLQLDPAFLFGLQIEQLLAVATVLCGLWYGVRPLLSPLRKLARLQSGDAAQMRAKEDSMAA